MSYKQSEGVLRRKREHYQRHREAELARTKRHQRAKRERLNEIKLARGCADCGYRGHPAALEFDHLPGNDKLRGVGSMVSFSWEAIEAEIAKCEVVCANCHAVRTAERRDNGD